MQWFINEIKIKPVSELNIPEQDNIQIVTFDDIKKTKRNIKNNDVDSHLFGNSIYRDLTSGDNIEFKIQYFKFC